MASCTKCGQEIFPELAQYGLSVCLDCLENPLQPAGQAVALDVEGVYQPCPQCGKPVLLLHDSVDGKSTCPHCGSMVQHPASLTDINPPSIHPDQPVSTSSNVKPHRSNTKAQSDKLLVEPPTPQPAGTPDANDQTVPTETSEQKEHFPKSSSLFRRSVTTQRPFHRWLICFVSIILLIGILCGGLIFSAITSDKSGICIAIILIFICAAVHNGYNVYQLDKQILITAGQLRHLHKVNQVSTFLRESDASLFRDHIYHLWEISRRDVNISQDNLIVLMRTRLRASTQITDICSGILVTLGLVGTIVGLIVSAGGLGDTIQAVGGDNNQLLSGMKVTIGGMGTAFYTTLTGAILGGIVLRLLSTFIDNSVDYLVSHIAEITEVYILPSLRRIARKTV